MKEHPIKSSYYLLKALLSAHLAKTTEERVEKFILIEELIAIDALVNSYTKSFRLPLVEICKRCNFQLVEMLLDAGADPLLPDGDGNTALSIAMEKGDKNIINMISLYATKQHPELTAFAPTDVAFLTTESTTSTEPIKNPKATRPWQQKNLLIAFQQKMSGLVDTQLENEYFQKHENVQAMIDFCIEEKMLDGVVKLLNHFVSLTTKHHDHDIVINYLLQQQHFIGMRYYDELLEIALNNQMTDVVDALLSSLERFRALRASKSLHEDTTKDLPLPSSDDAKHQLVPSDEENYKHKDLLGEDLLAAFEHNRIIAVQKLLENDYCQDSKSIQMVLDLAESKKLDELYDLLKERQDKFFRDFKFKTVKPKPLAAEIFTSPTEISEIEKKEMDEKEVIGDVKYKFDI